MRPELRLVIGHGSGSFGHVAAARYDTLAGVQGRCLIVSVTTDWRFSAARSEEIGNALMAARKDVR